MRSKAMHWQSYCIVSMSTCHLSTAQDVILLVTTGIAKTILYQDKQLNKGLRALQEAVLETTKEEKIRIMNVTIMAVWGKFPVGLQTDEEKIKQYDYMLSIGTI